MISRNVECTETWKRNGLMSHTMTVRPRKTSREESRCRGTESSLGFESWSTWNGFWSFSRKALGVQPSSIAETWWSSGRGIAAWLRPWSSSSNFTGTYSQVSIAIALSPLPLLTYCWRFIRLYQHSPRQPPKTKNNNERRKEGRRKGRKKKRRKKSGLFVSLLPLS